MPANTDPIFGLNGNSKPVTLTTANTASDGSGSLTTLVTAGANGTRVDSVTFRNAQATPAASSNQLGKIFLTDIAGANPRLIGEVAITGVTRSATQIGATTTFTFSPALVMLSGQLLQVCISVRASAADDTAVVAYGQDF